MASVTQTLNPEREPTLFVEEFVKALQNPEELFALPEAKPKKERAPVPWKLDALGSGVEVSRGFGVLATRIRVSPPQSFGVAARTFGFQMHLKPWLKRRQERRSRWLVETSAGASMAFQ